MGQTISDADIKRAREDPRFRQILLARSLDQLLGSLHRMQHAAGTLAPDARAPARGRADGVELRTASGQSTIICAGPQCPEPGFARCGKRGSELGSKRQ